MGKIYHSILELIGHTPLVELHRLEEAEGTEAHILAKLEYFNPAGSVKDRTALNMVAAYQRLSNSECRRDDVWESDCTR